MSYALMHFVFQLAIRILNGNNHTTSYISNTLIYFLENMNRTIVSLSAAALLLIIGTANGDAQYFGISSAR